VVLLRSRIPRIASTLVVLMVVVIPVMGTFDLLETFQAGRGAAYLEQTRAGGERVGVGLLYVREILLLLLTGSLFLWGCVVGQRLPRLPGMGFFSFCLGISFIVSIGLHPRIVLAAGLREIMYLVLLYALYLISRESDRTESLFVYAATGVSMVEILVASIQVVFFEAAAGTTLLGPRVYGTFNNPNTLAAFFAATTFFVLFMGRSPGWVKGGVVTIGVLSQLMAGSRTGMVAIAFLLFASLWRRTRRLEARGMLVVASFLLLVPLYYGLATLSGRGNVGTPVENPRLRIFREQIELMRPAELLFGRGLGVGTNTLYALGKGTEDPTNLITILDSTITALVVQIGSVGLIAYFLFLVALSARCGFAGWVLFGLVSVMGVSANWLEFYPINLIVTSAYGLLWAKADRLRIGVKESNAGIEVTDAAQGQIHPESS
jgi:hypothetical protein